jgi:hypothetical protein
MLDPLLAARQHIDKARPTRQAIDGEVAAVHRQDLARARSGGEEDNGRIREVHWLICILPAEFRDSAAIEWVAIDGHEVCLDRICKPLEAT